MMELIYTFPLWTFILFSSFFACSPVKGESLVIGSHQPIIAAPGDDVILPCHLEPQFNVEGLTVEWSKPDLKPDPADRLSRVEYVHLYRDRREVTDMKLPSYVSRTSLFTHDLKHGNISLKISNVTLADTGRYRCFIPKLKSRVKESVVQLVVDPDLIKTSTTETPLDPSDLRTPDPEVRTEVKGGRDRMRIWVPLLVFFVLLLGGVSAYFYKRLCKDDLKNESTHSNSTLV